MESKDVLYAKWLSGEIGDDELRSEAGEDAFSDLDRVIRAVDKWSMPRYDTSAGYRKFKQVQHTKQAKLRKISWLKVSGIAASFLILIFLRTYLFTFQNQVQFAEYGSTENISLDDGTEITLNDGSTIEYNENKWADQRIIELTGEALFEVSKGKPFIVKTQNGSIRVLGTQFNVKAWGGNLYVECYEGRVQVESNNQKMILTANEAVDIVLGSMNEKQEIANVTPPWQNAMSKFSDDKLRNVFQEFERQYNVKLTTMVEDRNFSGNFSHGNLETALRMICKPLGLTFTISEDQKTIVVE